MTTITVENKEVVVPGEILAQGMDNLPGQGTYRDGERIIASQLGLVNIDGRTIKLIPLNGRYAPKKGDVIICQVSDVNIGGWRLETNTAYSAMLSMKEGSSEFIARGADLTRYYSIGDLIACKIVNVTSQKLIDVSMKGPGLSKLKGGRIIEVNANKVPRIIGKAGSMVSMIKQATGCRIIIGQNGLVWISGEPKAEYLVVQAIEKILNESHVSGLTDRVKAFLEENKVN